MKKVALLILVLFVAAFASAQNVNGGPVALKAVIPSYIGIGSPSVSTVTFDYTNLGVGIAMGLPITKLASALPTWNLMYNLDGTKSVQVCAYATALVDGSSSIPASSLYAQPIGGSSTTAFTASACGQSNAMLLDTVANATSNSGKSEGFSGMFLQTPDGTVVKPGTYNGTLNIVAQVI
jgi:hypothetical protein